MARKAPRGELAQAWRLAALAAAYAVTGGLGLALSPVSGFASLVWPPAAISLVAVLLGGFRLWPGVMAGAFLANVWRGAPPLVALGVAIGSTLEAILGAWALLRVPGFRGSLDRFVEVVSLVLAAAAVALVAATIGCASLVVGGVASPAELARTWATWWTGDFMAILVLAPMLLTWARSPRIDTRFAALAEVALLGASLLGGSLLVFAPRGPAESPIFRPTLLFVPVIWGAFRFGTRGAATAAGVVAAVAVVCTYTGRGPFARATPIDGLLALHAYLVSVSLPALTLGAVVCELRASRIDLLAALEQAHAAARAKDDFLAVLSHELRTPLQAILGWTHLLKTRAHDKPLVGRGLATIERSAAAQAHLIEDLLDVSRIVAGKLRIDRKAVDLSGVITAAVESTRSAAEVKSLQVELLLAPLRGVVIGDPARLQQIVANLLTNAVKFTPSGGSIAVRLERAGAAARIVVADTGCGISSDLLPHVFDRFRQGDAGATRAQAGLGLGLAIVRHLVELHGGKVTAESPGDGRGATFTVTLPVVSAARVAPHVAREETEATWLPGVLDGVRVLVVDDDPDARELLDIVLHEAGAEVHAVCSARAAVGELASFRPDLLLSDIGMPDEDGYALIREVRSQEGAQGGRLPAIALTAFASNADREKALACGFDVHVAKPVDGGGLATLAATLLRRAAAT